MKELQKEFDDIYHQYDHDDKSREQVVILARDIIRPSKQAIYALHRGDEKKAKELLSKAKENIDKGSDLIKSSKGKDIGAFRAGLEEYVEAQTYYSFITTNSIPTRNELGINLSYETYLAALCDFSGELIRKAVVSATNNDKETVIKIQNLIQELYELFLKFDFRSGELRRKFDSLKYHLAKIEDIRYDMNKR